MYKIRDYECGTCGNVWEALTQDDEPEKCRCGVVATRIMSAPAIHTLETHMRGYRGELPNEQYNQAHGFRDPHLTDRQGNPLCYNSLSEKNRLLKEQGLEIKESKMETRRRSKRPMLFTGQKNRGSQLGIVK